jgi:hypothetical protein
VRQGQPRRLDDGPIESTSRLGIRHGSKWRPSDGLGQPAAALLDPTDQERRHHRMHEHGAEVPLP